MQDSVVNSDSITRDMKPAFRFGECVRASCTPTCDMPLSILISGLPMAKLKSYIAATRQFDGHGKPKFERRERATASSVFLPENMESIHQTHAGHFYISLYIHFLQLHLVTLTRTLCNLLNSATKRRIAGVMRLLLLGANDLTATRGAVWLRGAKALTSKERI